MPRFSQTSEDHLSTCHPALQRLMFNVIGDYDISILEGYRTVERQLELYDQGKTKFKFSKHNVTIVHNKKILPWSNAVDIAPYPTDFGRTPREILESQADTAMTAENIALLEREFIRASETIARFYYLAGLVKERADHLFIRIRWGGDRDGDNDFLDQTFDDLVHFELDDEYKDFPWDDGGIDY